MNEAVDGGGGGHGVFEDSVPLAEDQVAGDEDALALVALGQKREEDLHFVAALLHVSKVVDEHGVECVQRGQFGLQAQIALGGQQALHEGVRGHEEHAVAPLDELVGDGAHDVGLAPAGQAEGEQILAALDEAALTQRRQQLLELG